MDGALDDVDGDRPLPAPSRLPPLGRRARSRAADAVHRRGRARLRDGELRVRRALPLPRLRRRERRRDERAVGRRRRVATRTGFEALLPLVPQLDDAHAVRRAPLGAQGVAAGEGGPHHGHPVRRPGSARRAVRELPRGGGARVRDVLRRLPPGDRRPRPTGADRDRVRRRPRRVVGRALRRQVGDPGHLPHARRRSLRRGRPRAARFSPPLGSSRPSSHRR